MSSGILKKIWIVGLVVLVVLGLAQIYSGGTDTVVRPAKPTAAPKQAVVKLAEPKEQRPFAEASADDPVMRNFAGIAWGMTEAELTEWLNGKHIWINEKKDSIAVWKVNADGFGYIDLERIWKLYSK